MSINQGSQRLGAVDDPPSVGAVRIDEGLQVTPGVAPTGTPKTAMQRRAEAAIATGDEDKIVAQIEATRIELALTFEELADRLAPKHVADRTKAQLIAAAKEKGDQAKQVVASSVETAKHALIVAKEKAAVAAEQAKERAALAAEAAKDKAGAAAETAMEKAHLGHASDDDDASEVGSVRASPSSLVPLPRPGSAPSSSSTSPVAGAADFIKTMAADRPEIAVAGSVAVVLSLVWVVERVRA